MISEKLFAALEVQQRAAIALLSGNPAAIPHQTLGLYRRKIRANHRRLSGGAARRALPARGSDKRRAP